MTGGGVRVVGVGVCLTTTGECVVGSGGGDFLNAPHTTRMTIAIETTCAATMIEITIVLFDELAAGLRLGRIGDRGLGNCENGSATRHLGMRRRVGNTF